MARHQAGARAALGLLALVALPLAGCGGSSSAGAEEPELVVFAASSLGPAFERYAAEFEGADVQLSLAGSDALAAQIRQGLSPDVYAAANTELPERLYDEGLVSRPEVFAANELVLAVPRGSAIGGLAAAAESGIALGIGDEDVPVGAYARQLLGELDGDLAERILANVRTSEPEVAGIVAKLDQEAIDAGFVYASDVAASEGALQAIPLPRRLAPAVAYGAAVGAASSRPELGRRFVDGLLDGPGARALAANGFEPPPEG